MNKPFIPMPNVGNWCKIFIYLFICLHMLEIIFASWCYPHCKLINANKIIGVGFIRKYYFVLFLFQNLTMFHKISQMFWVFISTITTKQRKNRTKGNQTNYFMIKSVCCLPFFPFLSVQHFLCNIPVSKFA